MYGLVNKGLEALVRREHGDAAWAAVQEKAGVHVPLFTSMRAYDDELTYRLVGAASEVLGRPAPELLEAFGRHWVRYTAQEGYGDLLLMSGPSLFDFLANLDNLHARVGLVFPELKPPSFRCTNVTPTSLDLHYHSHRAGLAPLVVGLLAGLAERFAQPLRVTHVAARGPELDHDVFHVELAT